MLAQSCSPPPPPPRSMILVTRHFLSGTQQEFKEVLAYNICWSVWVAFCESCLTSWEVCRSWLGQPLQARQFSEPGTQAESIRAVPLHPTCCVVPMPSQREGQRSISSVFFKKMHKAGQDAETHTHTVLQQTWVSEVVHTTCSFL